MKILIILFLLFAVYLSLVIASVAAKRRRTHHRILSSAWIVKTAEKIAAAETMKAAEEQADPCDTCLRWPECNGADRDTCPNCRTRTEGGE